MPLSSSRLTRAGDTGGATRKTYQPSDHEAVTKAARGVADRADSTLSFDAGTRTSTITPVNGAWSYYIAGRRYIKSAAESIIIADTSGVHWIYYDGATLSEAVNPSHATVDDLIVNKVRVGVVYWNATDSAGYVVADERHGPAMSGETQKLWHDAIGARWHIGLDVSGYTLDTDNDASVDFEVSDGEICDEDICHEIADGNPANQYEQQLNGASAEIPILYRDDVDGTWTEDAATTLPYKHSGADRLAYNKDDGDGTWSQPEVDNNKFVMATLIATNDWQYPVKMVQGQAQYATKTLALEGADAEQIAWGTMPSPEFVVLFRFVMQTNTGFGGTNNCKIISLLDLRQLTLTGGAAAPPQPHPILSNTHSDSVAAAVTAGALLYGNATPEWAKHALVTLDAAGVMSGLTQLNVDDLRLDSKTLSVTGIGSLILEPAAATHSGVICSVVGVATTDIHAWAAQNSVWNAAMTDTRTSLSFWQAFNAGGDIAEAARITTGTEGNWGVAATQDAYLAFFTGLNGTATEKMRINSAGAVGINTDEPGGNIATDLLDIRQNAARCTMGLYTHHNTNATIASSFYGSRARGTQTVPAVVQNGDRLFAFNAMGYDTGASWRVGANIIFEVDGVVGANAIPTRIAFWTGPTGPTRTERLAIQGDGNILVDTDSELRFRDAGLLINSSLDGQLDIDADVQLELTAPTIELTASTAVVVTGANGIYYVPGADIDVDVATVNVTGAPKLWWDESEDALAMTHRLSLPEGVQTKYATDDVSDPPTDAELDAAFGDPTEVGPGFVGILDDNGAGLYCYICWTTGTAGEWFYLAGTKAV